MSAGEGPSLEGRFELRPGETLRNRAARGTIINAAFLSGLNVLGLVKGFLVAALLTTTEYGVWGVLFVSLNALLWLKHVGVSDKYVQQDEPDQELAFQKAFTIELLFSAALFVLLVAAVPVLAVITGHDELIPPGLVLAAALPAGALAAPVWVFYRRMDFLRQRLLQSIDPVLGFVVTVVLALAGTGYWSLVIGIAAGAWCSAIAALASSPYRLTLRFDRSTLREYVSFSWPVLVATLAGMLIAQLSILAGEAELGLAGAGAITLAATLVSYTDRIDQVITATLYPAICAVRERTDLLFESFVKSNRLALMWGIPFGVGIALFASDLVEFLIGEEWRFAVGLMQAFGLIAAVNHVGFNWEAYYRARGETRPLAVVTVLTLIAFVVLVLPLLVAEGLDGFALGMGGMAVVALAGRWFYVSRLFPGFAAARHAARAIAPTLPAAGAVLLLRLLQQGERGPALALGELVLYVLVTCAATFVLERPLIREVRGYLRRSPAAVSG
jgi:O-antigen/teichoic acid export membrane protein